MRGLAIRARNTLQKTPFRLLRPLCAMAEASTPTKASRSSPDQSRSEGAEDDSVPDEFLKYYKMPLGIEVDVDKLVIDKQKKHGQIRKYRQARVDEVKRSLLANPPEEPIIVTAWQSPSMLVVSYVFGSR